MSWTCECGILNSGLINSYKCAGEINPAAIKYSGNHNPITANSYDELTSIVDIRKVRDAMTVNNTSRPMTDAEELHKKWFFEEKILVKDMASADLRERFDQLALVAGESRSRMSAIDWELRERTAKSKIEAKDWLIPADSNTLVTNAINAVGKKKRLNSAERLNEQMKKYGIDDETRKLALVNVEKAQGLVFVDKESGLTKSEIIESESKVSNKLILAENSSVNSGELIGTSKTAFNPSNLFKK